MVRVWNPPLMPSAGEASTLRWDFDTTDRGDHASLCVPVSPDRELARRFFLLTRMEKHVLIVTVGACVYAPRQDFDEAIQRAEDALLPLSLELGALGLPLG
jgi:hypothetical protein